MNISGKSHLLATLFLVAAPLAATAATLQFTLTNLAPAGSLGFEPVLFAVNMQDVSEVTLTTVDGGMDLLPQITFQLASDGAGVSFPPLAGGIPLPVLQPGDSVSFSLNSVNLLAEGTLYFGSSLFSLRSIAVAGTFMEADLTLTAGDLLEFDGLAGGAPRLVIPGSPEPGPASITSSTPVFGLNVVPEPGTMLLVLPGFALAVSRRRAGTC